VPFVPFVPFVLRAGLIFAAVPLWAAPAVAQQRAVEEQRVEITPFGGYRFGWGVSDVGGIPVVDDDGGVSFGAIVDVPLGRAYDDLLLEAVFSREQARVRIQPPGFFSTRTTASVEVDHLMVGVSRELEESSPRARPFISALVGLTRYAAADDFEVRFSVGLGFGGKFYPTRHLGFRLDARGYMTIISVGGAGACSGGCTLVFAANPVFQADLTAGVIVAF
jgi:hypothetical protein